MFSLFCARINDWVINSEAGDLRRHRTHHDVTVMIMAYVMVCWLTAPSHYLNQRLFIIDGFRCDAADNQFTSSTQACIPKHEYDKYT